MGLRRSIISGILPWLPICALYFHITLRINTFIDFVYCQVTLGLIFVYFSHRMYRNVIVPLQDYFAHGTVKRILHVNQIWRSTSISRYFPFDYSSMKTTGYKFALYYPGYIPEFDTKSDRIEACVLEKSQLIISFRILYSYTSTTHS